MKPTTTTTVKKPRRSFSRDGFLDEVERLKPLKQAIEHDFTVNKITVVDAALKYSNPAKEMAPNTFRDACTKADIKYPKRPTRQPKVEPETPLAPMLPEARIQALGDRIAAMEARSKALTTVVVRNENGVDYREVRPHAQPPEPAAQQDLFVAPPSPYLGRPPGLPGPPPYTGKPADSETACN